MLHPTTFNYLKPTIEQIDRMQGLRELTSEYANKVDDLLDDGPDKTYIMRKIREVGMWINVSVTRNADGSPRSEEE